MIITVTSTVMSGTVVRWYYDSDSVEHLDAIEPMISASRDGVRVPTFLHLVPADVMVKAQKVYETLRQNRDADVSHLATHRRYRGEFVPVGEGQERRVTDPSRHP